MVPARIFVHQILFRFVAGLLRELVLHRYAKQRGAKGTDLFFDKAIAQLLSLTGQRDGYDVEQMGT